MSENPYAAPNAKLGDQKPSERRGSAWLAVIVGWFTDIAGTMVFATVALLVIGIVLGALGARDADLRAFEQSGAWQAFGLLFGMSFTALGGYVTARIANHAEYRLALLMGIASLATGELLMQLGEGDHSAFWIRLVGFVFTIPAALFGAWFYLQRKQGTAAQ
jgi:hypothetical protein